MIRGLHTLKALQNTLVEYEKMDEISYFYPDVKIIDYLDMMFLKDLYFLLMTS